MSTRVEPEPPSATDPVEELSYREAIRAAMEDEMAVDPKVLLLGEDVANGGGVFKTNDGLLERFGPERVRNTPICENGFLGVALGMAVTGMRPIVEIMFSDFLPTAADAIVNELPKFRFMSGGQCNVPLTIRSIGGATGRFGTQHSATGESWYIGLPGLKVASAGTPSGAYAVLRAAIRDPNPVLFFEHKGLYSTKAKFLRTDGAVASVGQAAVLREGTDVTIVATLLMASRALQAADVLAKGGVSAEVIDLRWLRPLDYPTVVSSVSKTKRIVAVEEQVHAGGWGATIISKLAQDGTSFAATPRAIALDDDVPIPYSPSLEDELVATVDRIVREVGAVMAP
jgi:pyruvate/2-oxoglutarate/acetoin dehydrogenase E1 component